jgi:CO/xanthine dehydrogenase FAD-binding subunit
LVTAIRIPKNSAAGTSSFFKLGARRYLVISIAMAAARIVVDNGIVSEAALAIGACSAVAMRLRSLEEALVGGVADASLANAFDPEHFAVLSPIDDVRGSAEYRREAAREIAMRAVTAAVQADVSGRTLAA